MLGTNIFRLGVFYVIIPNTRYFKNWSENKTNNDTAKLYCPGYSKVSRINYAPEYLSLV